MGSGCSADIGGGVQSHPQDSFAKFVDKPHQLAEEPSILTTKPSRLLARRKSTGDLKIENLRVETPKLFDYSMWEPKDPKAAVPRKVSSWPAIDEAVNEIMMTRRRSSDSLMHGDLLKKLQSQGSEEAFQAGILRGF